jgi:predicted transcriptional regulator of viral defense system
MSKYYEKLSKLKSVELLQILHDCVELLAPVSPAELAKMQGKSKRAILHRIEAGKYLIFEFDGRKYPVVNDHF